MGKRGEAPGVRVDGLPLGVSGVRVARAGVRVARARVDGLEWTGSGGRVPLLTVAGTAPHRPTVAG
ncbi:hypothetical protein ACWDRB_61355 [Nonomuraea sp. NPDC003707]